MQRPADTHHPTEDAVDEIRAQWQDLRPDLDLEVIDIIGRVSRSSALIVRASDLLLARSDLTRGEFDILTALRRTSTPQSPGSLRTIGLATGPATTKRLRSLVQRGYVERSVNPSDARGALIALTDLGTRLVDEVFPEVLALERELLGRVAPTERAAIADGLRQVLTSVESYIAPK